MAGRLEGKVAIITGAGSGLGRASAALFAAEGASVACADRNFGGVEATAAAIVDRGGSSIAVRVDVTSEADTEQMVQTVLEAFGRIDVLYANAGVAGIGSVTTTTTTTWDQVIAVNLTGVWLSDKAVVAVMESQGSGSIINQASIGGLIGVPGITSYAAAKAGVIGLTRQAAVEYGPANIRFNAICPGTIPTQLVVDTYAGRAGIGASVGESVEEGLAAAAARYPLRRLGEPGDVANMALFLASDESKWITGGVFTVDGGFTAA